jgi:predicted DNA-binding protein
MKIETMPVSVRLPLKMIEDLKTLAIQEGQISWRVIIREAIQEKIKKDLYGPDTV